MKRLLFAHFVFAIALGREALAVAIGAGPAFTYQTSTPTPAQVENWNIGWGATTATGWDYVGSIPNNGSAVYLGNNWVLTADHATSDATTAAYFDLNGTRYNSVPGSRISIEGSPGRTADIELFRIATAPTLPPLTIRSTAPEVVTYFNPGSEVVFIGYGSAGRGKTWGANTVTAVNVRAFTSNTSPTDFRTRFGEFGVIDTSGGGVRLTLDGVSKEESPPPGPTPVPTPDARLVNNNARLASGDSGGGGFIFNAATGQWELAGINRAINPSTGESSFAQLDVFAGRINQITGVPEPAPIVLIGLGLLALGWKLRSKRVSRAE